MLRRAGSPTEPNCRIGEIVVDLDKRAVTMRGEPVHLTPHEFELLRVLAQNEGKLMTHKAILREVWGPAYQQESSYLHVYVSQLRRKLEARSDPATYILTEPGAGIAWGPADPLFKDSYTPIRGTLSPRRGQPSYLRVMDSSLRDAGSPIFGPRARLSARGRSLKTRRSLRAGPPSGRPELLHRRTPPLRLAWSVEELVSAKNRLDLAHSLRSLCGT